MTCVFKVWYKSNETHFVEQFSYTKIGNTFKCFLTTEWIWHHNCLFLTLSNYKNNLEICSNVFAVSQTNQPQKTLNLFEETYGVKVMSRDSIFQWYKSFIEGSEYVEDEFQAGWLSTSCTQVLVITASCTRRSSYKCLMFSWNVECLKWNCSSFSNGRFVDEMSCLSSGSSLP